MSKYKEGEYSCNLAIGMRVKGVRLSPGRRVTLTKEDLNEGIIASKIDAGHLIYVSPRHEKILKMESVISSENIEVIPDKVVQLKRRKKKEETEDTHD